VKSYDAAATIAAPPETIWSILTDAPAYAQWDSGVRKVEGRIAPGEKIKVVSGANPGTRFVMREECTGPLLPMIWRSMPDLGPSFEQFARGLKARAEAD
jgi:hypothetical protein